MCNQLNHRTEEILLIPVFQEVILQMINDVCLEDFHLLLISEKLCISFHSHIKSKDARKSKRYALAAYQEESYRIRSLTLVCALAWQLLSGHLSCVLDQY